MLSQSRRHAQHQRSPLPPLRQHRPATRLLRRSLAKVGQHCNYDYMGRRIRKQLSIIALSLCVGCGTSHPVVSAQVDRAVETPASFQRARAIDRDRVVWFSDGVDGHYPIIYVGFDTGTHTCRSATLRVREHGVVGRQEMREDGELIWIADN